MYIKIHQFETQSSLQHIEFNHRAYTSNEELTVIINVTSTPAISYQDRSLASFAHLNKGPWK